AYYNTKPTLRLAYLYDNGARGEQDSFSRLTKELLLQNQWLVEFQYQKDITSLDKNSSNGPQNIIDPYNVFSYPLDYFVEGSEYAVAFAGSHSSFATNVVPQNYHLLQTVFTYGITDTLNIALTAGYRSENSLHHFTLNDLRSRFYTFKPYYYFDVASDWRITENSLLSFQSHFVPRYETILEYQGDPESYQSRNRYFEIQLAFKVLF
ncbi:MAG: hypothetical protein JSW40_08655, partial [Candidatus Omnitrophota bacterium]